MIIIICPLYFNITLTTITEVAPGIQTDSTSHQICDIPLWRYRYNCQFRIREDYAKHFLHYCRILCQYLEKYVINRPQLLYIGSLFLKSFLHNNPFD